MEARGQDESLARGLELRGPPSWGSCQIVGTAERSAHGPIDASLSLTFSSSPLAALCLCVDP